MMFSVLVPMYNVEKFAEQCIASIEKQTFRDFELIIVDDGSTDGTGDIIDKAAGLYNNIIAIHKSNGGLTSARKEAARLARGDYSVIIDGDDFVCDHYLESFADIIGRYNPDLVVCNYKNIYPDGRTEDIDANDSLFGIYAGLNLSKDIKPHLFRYSFSVWGKAIESSKYLEYQMQIDDSISIGEDGCIMYPLIASVESIYYINDYLYCYRSNDTSLTKNKGKYIPWDSCLWRIHYLSNALPLQHYNLDKQFAGYVIHAASNAVITQMRRDRYSDVKRSALTHLDDPIIRKYIMLNDGIYTRKERIMRFLLRNRLLFLIKMYTLI